MSLVPFQLIDLNLLRVFDAMIDQRSVTRAGEQLKLTPSAISHALNRLRSMLGDELFLRTPNGMRPTPYAAEIGPHLRAALATVQRALNQAPFSPADTHRQFEVSATPYVCSILITRVVRRMQDIAPHATLRIAPSRSGVFEDLESGRTDIAICAAGRRSDHFAAQQLARIYSEELLRDRLVWAMRHDHPVALAGELTLEAVAGLAEVAIGLVEGADGSVQRFDRAAVQTDLGVTARALMKAGLKQRIGMIVPDMAAALAMAGATDMAALVPFRLADKVRNAYGLALRELPYDCPPMDYHMRCRLDVRDDPGILWLMGVLRTVAAEIQAEPADISA